MRKIVLSISCLFASLLTFSQVGNPDPGFANGTGKVVNYSTTGRANAVAIQSDGKIVMAGDGFVLMRYNTDGTIDNNFGSGGKVTIFTTPPAPSGYYYQLNSATAVGVQNNNIIVAGTVVLRQFAYPYNQYTQFIIFRLTPTGTVDLSFGGNNTGYIVKQMGSGDDEPTCIAFQSNNQILVGGFSQFNSNYAYCVLRLNSNGTVDTNFGGMNQTAFNYRSDGVALITVSYNANPSDKAYSLAVQSSDQNIFICGNNGFAKLLTNGRVDPSYNSPDNRGGIIRTNSSGITFQSCALQSDGKIVVSGYNSNGIVPAGTTVWRYNTNGSPDNTFSGAIVNSLGNSSYTPTSMVLQSDGKIVVTASNFASNVDFKIARFKINGTLDNNFSTGGVATLHFGPTTGYYSTTASSSNAVAFNNGRIYVAGSTNYTPSLNYYYNSPNYFALASLIGCSSPTATITAPQNVCPADAPGAISITGSNGTPPYTFTYNINNATIAQSITSDNTGVSKITPAAGNNTYKILTASDIYSCSVTNVTGTATVNLLIAPSINTQPSNAVICNGTSARFSVNAGGSLLTYQWQEGIVSGGDASWSNITDGGIYSGSATATLTLTNPSIALSGNHYQCILSNSCNTIITNGSATLTVAAAPSMFNITGGGSYCNGGAGFPIGLDGSEEGVTYQLYNNTTAVGAIINGDGSPLSFGNRTAAGTYTIVAKNISTNCTLTMHGNAVITVIQRPSASIISPNVTLSSGSTNIRGTISATGNGVLTLTGGITYPFTSGTTSFSIPVSPVTTTTYYITSLTDQSTCTPTPGDLTGSETVTVNDIKTAALARVYCAGSTVTVVYTAIGAYNAGNIFTAQLSNASGSFAAPVNIGTVTSGTSGSINAIIPVNTIPGTGYRIRVVSSTPAFIGSDNGANITINPLPSGTISGTASVCQNATAPNVTFTGSNGTAPYTFTYKINNGAPLTVTTTSGNTVTVNQSTTTAGTFLYSLVSVQDASSTQCSKTITGQTATITVNPLPTSNISGTTSVCQNAAAPNVTFTGSNGTAPYTFTYTINNGAPQTVTSTSGSSVTVSQSTAMPGTYLYALVSVQDASSTQCSQTISGQTALITINTAPTISATNITGVYSDINSCGATVTFGSNVTATGTPAPLLTYQVGSTTIASPYTFPVGMTAVTLTASNSCGIIRTVFNVTVVDNIPPTVHTNDVTIYLDSTGRASITAAQINNNSTDNCSIAANGYALDKYNFDCGNVGQNTVTLTVTDVNGVIATRTATVTVIDNQKPVITTNGDKSVNNDADKCGALVTVSAVTSDNCSVGLATGVRSDGLALNAIYPVGTTTITWNVTDANGNTALPVTQTVVVTDNQKPVITTNGDKNVNNDADKCGALVTVSASASDNCSVGLATGVRSDGLALNALYPVGTTTITWNVTDANGNAAVAVTQTVVVTDNQKPVITTNGDKNVNNDVDKCGAAVTVSATATDNCSVGLATGVRSDGLALNALYPVGTTTVTWNVTDANGNTALPVTQTVVVTDNQKPVITTNGDKNVNNDINKCGAAVTVSATATDNCSVGLATGVRSDGLALNALFPVGTTTITWNVTDANGNAALSVTQTVVVMDIQKPVITTNGDKNVNNDLNKCGALVSVLAVTSDNCSAGSATGVRSDGLALNALFPVGTTTITWNVTDANGNAAVPVIQTVVVTDNQKPVITTNGDKNVNNDLNKCGALVSVSAVTSDNCSVGSATGVRSDGLALNAIYPVGTTTITWNVTDANGNTALPVTQTVVVTDNQKPVITTNGNKDVNNDVDKCGALVTVSASTLDNCSVGSATGVRSDGLALNALYPVGTTTITWNVTDANGNPALPVTQTVVVTDNQKPVITTNGNKNVNNDVDKCGALVNVSASTLDNCSVGSTTGVRSDGLALNALYPVGTTTVTWNVTDANGNTALPVTQTVVVTDNQKPVITTNGDKNVNNDLNKCGALVSVSAVTSDNCSAGSATGVRSDGLALNALFPVGTTTITWNVTDANGNTALPVTQTVVVTDNQKPVITTNGDKNVNNDINKCGAAVTVSATATDNCSVGLATGVRSDGLALNALYPVGTTTITWNVTDANGNAAVAVTQTVVVTDNQKPVITTNGDKNVNNDVDKCGAAVTVSATATDNCSVGLATGVRSDGLALNALYPVGTTTVTWNVTDANGNTALPVTQTVVVTDNQKPVITTNGDKNVNNDINKCGATVTVSATATDNCSVGLATGVRSDGLALNALFPVGTTTITWNVTDANGNAALSVTQTVVVMDIQKPVITTNGDKNVNNDLNKCGALVSVSAVTSDNCSAGSATGVRSDGLALNALFPVGTTTITWNVTDANGNAAVPVIQTVVVTDNEKPVVTCPQGPIRLCFDAQGSYIVPHLIASDNCGILTTKFTITGATTRSGSGNDASGLFNVGVSTIAWTVTDVHGNTNSCSSIVDINKQLIVTIADQYAVNPGGNVNTIYLGYGPQSLTYSAAVSANPYNGSGTGYTYQWKKLSPSPVALLGTASSQTVSPTIAGTYIYSVTVTDSRGCTATRSITVNVVDIRSGQKVVVCHKGNSLTVSANAIPAHLAHGDYLGYCLVNSISVIANKQTKQTDAVITKGEQKPVVKDPKLSRSNIETPAFKVIVAPNPSTSDFKIRVQSNSNEAITIRVINAFGKTIAILTGVQNNQVIEFGSTYSGGSYFAEVFQGNIHKTVRLIKLKHADNQ